MTTSGHRTRAVFDHYNFSDERGSRRAQEQMASYLEAICQKRRVVGFHGGAVDDS